MGFLSDSYRILMGFLWDCYGIFMGFNGIYTLVNCHNYMENHYYLMAKSTNLNGIFLIAILVDL